MAARIAEEPGGILAGRRLEGGDASFSELYRRFFPWILRLCNRRLGDSAAAEDAAQETFVRVLRSFARFDPSRPIWPWLKVIAMRVAADYASSKAREARRLNDRRLLPPEEDAEWNLYEERSLLALAISRLKPRQQIALRLRYLEDWAPSEAARILGLSKGGFEQLLYRARQRVRTEYCNLSREVTGKMRLAFPPILGRFFARVRSKIAKVRSDWEEALGLGPLSTSFAGVVTTLLAATLIFGGTVGLTYSFDNGPANGAGASETLRAVPNSPISSSKGGARSLNSPTTQSGYSRQFTIGASPATASVSSEVTKKKLAIKVDVSTPDHSIVDIPISLSTDAECDYSAVRTLACEVVDLLPQQVP